MGKDSVFFIFTIFSKGGLNSEQWGISILLGASGILWSYILRFIPEQKCLKVLKVEKTEIFIIKF